MNRVNAVVNTFARQKGVLKYRQYRKVNDLLSLIALSNAYCSAAVQHHQGLKIQNLIDRMQRYASDYTKTPELVKMFTIFCKIIDNK